MKHPFRSHFLPLFPIAAGLVGLLLRVWLFSAIDEKGLLPAAHFADTALYILTAITLGVLFLSSRNFHSCSASKKIPPLIPALGCLLGGIGMLLAGFSRQSVRFSGISAAVCLTGGLLLLIMAVLEYFQKKIPYGFPAVLTVALMLDTIAQCQDWGKLPQLQEYFFSLMACVFLILSAYHITLRVAGSGKPSLLAFFSQSAIFFCFTCLNTNRWFLYLGLIFWVTTSLYSWIHKEKEA